MYIESISNSGMVSGMSQVDDYSYIGWGGAFPALSLLCIVLKRLKRLFFHFFIILDRSARRWLAVCF